MEFKLLQSTDVTGGTFSLTLIGMLGTTVLLFLGTGWVEKKWKLPVALAGIVTLLAATQYVQEFAAWLHTGQMPVIYRYVDWLITVPVQVLALYFFIGAVQAPPIGLFWRLLVVAVVTILARYMGEVEFMNPTLGFLIGIVGWLYILGEVFFGKLSEINAKSANETVQIRVLLAAPDRNGGMGGLSIVQFRRQLRRRRRRGQAEHRLQSRRFR